MAYSAAHPGVRSGANDNVSQAMAYGGGEERARAPRFQPRVEVRPAERAAGAPTGRHPQRDVFGGGGFDGGIASVGGGGGGGGGRRGFEEGPGGLGLVQPNPFGLPVRQPLPPPQAVRPAMRAPFDGAAGGGNLESRVAALERALSQHDVDMHTLKQDAAVARDSGRQLHAVDEQLRALGGLQAETAKRMRWLEETVGTSEGRGTGGAAHSERLRQLGSELEQALQAQKQSEARIVQLVSEQRRELGAMLGESTHAVDSRLTEKLAQLHRHTDEQLKQAQNERRKMDEATKHQLATQSAEVVGRLRQLETQSLPASERKLREELGGLRNSVGNSISQMASDLKSAVDTCNAVEEHAAKQIKDAHGLTQRSLLSLRAESEKGREALGRLLKEEISTRTLNTETINATIEELRTRLENDMEGCGQEIASLQGELHDRVEMVKASVAQVEQAVADARSYTDEAAAGLRVEIGQHADTVAAQARHAAEVSESLDRGLKELADRLQHEANERSQAVANSLQVTAGVEEALRTLQTEMRAAMAKTEMKVASEGGERRALAVALREDISSVSKDAEQALLSKTIELAAALVDAEQRWESNLSDANGALQNEMQEDRSAFQLKLRDVTEDSAGSVERLEAELTEQIGELRGTVVDDLTHRLGTLQEETSATLLGFREHMDNEFEAEGDRRDELRDELKSLLEGQTQDMKGEMEFRISSCEEQLLSHGREELTSATSQWEGELRKLHAEMQQAIDVLDDQLVEARGISKDVQVVRARMTASEETVAKINQQVRTAFADVAEQRDQDEQSNQERFDGLTATLGSASNTIEEATFKLEQLIRQESELRERIVAAEEKLQATTDGITAMDQLYRLHTVRIEERNTRISARLTRQESTLEDTRVAATAHEKFTQAMDKRLSKTITDTAGTLTNVIAQNTQHLAAAHKQHVEKVAKEQLEAAHQVRDTKAHLVDAIHAAREASSAAISAARADAENARVESVVTLSASLDEASAATEAKHSELIAKLEQHETAAQSAHAAVVESLRSADEAIRSDLTAYITRTQKEAVETLSDLAKTVEANHQANMTALSTSEQAAENARRVLKEKAAADLEEKRTELVKRMSEIVVEMKNTQEALDTHKVAATNHRDEFDGLKSQWQAMEIELSHSMPGSEAGTVVETAVGVAIQQLYASSEQNQHMVLDQLTASIAKVEAATAQSMEQSRSDTDQMLSKLRTDTEDSAKNTHEALDELKQKINSIENDITLTGDGAVAETVVGSALVELKQAHEKLRKESDEKMQTVQKDSEARVEALKKAVETSKSADESASSTGKDLEERLKAVQENVERIEQEHTELERSERIAARESGLLPRELGDRLEKLEKEKLGERLVHIETEDLGGKYADLAAKLENLGKETKKATATDAVGGAEAQPIVGTQPQ